MEVTENEPHVMFIEYERRRYYFLFESHADHICKTMSESNSFYEIGLLEAIASSVAELDYVIDVGANVGTHTVYFAGVSGCRVIAFEPVQKSANFLRENIRINGLTDLVDVHELALGSARTHASINRKVQNNAGATSLNVDPQGSIELVTLDSLLPNIPEIKLIKVDVEGMEAEVLTGGRALLHRDKPIVACECIDDAAFLNVNRVMRSMGYVAADVFNATPTYIFLPTESNNSATVAAFRSASAMRCRRDVQKNAAITRKVSKRVEVVSQELLNVANSLRTVQCKSDEMLSDVQSIERRVNTSFIDMESIRRWQTSAELSINELAEKSSRFNEIVVSQVTATDSLRILVENSQRRESESVKEAIKQLVDLHGRREASMNSEIQRLSLRVDRADRRHDKLINGRVLGTLRRTKQILQKLGLFRDRPRQVRASTVAAHKTHSTSANEPTAAVPSALPRPEKTRIAGVSYMARKIGGVVGHETVVEGSPLLSVVMTSYNTGTLIDAAVQSILNQTWSNFELIVVDDCSSDDTRERVRKFADADERVRLFCLGVNRGTYWCKNFGIVQSRGVAVTFMDSDDTSDPERLALQFSALNRPRLAVSTCNHVRLDAGGHVVAVNGITERIAYISQMIKRKVFDEIGYFDSIRTSADDEFLRRLKITYGIEAHTNVKKVLYRALVREGSLTQDPDNAINFLGVRNEGNSFLSPQRRHYAAMASRWHEYLREKNLRPYVPFPVVRRPFPVFGKLSINERNRDDDIISVGLASFPARVDKLEKAIASLLPQVDQIYIYLNQYQVVPEYLKHSRITVELGGTERDLRDNGKFFFVEKAKPGYFFTADDDITYPSDYVQTLIRAIEFYERKAIVGVHGTIFAKPLIRYFKGRTVYHFEHELAHDVVVNQLGTGTAAFHTSLIRPSLESFGSTGMADVWFALSAKARAIPLIVLRRCAGWLQSIGSDENNLFSEYRHEDWQQTKLVKAAVPWHEDLPEELSQVLADRSLRYGSAYSNLLPRPAAATVEQSKLTPPRGQTRDADQASFVAHTTPRPEAN